MTTQPYALLLVGSAKSPGTSTSEALGAYLSHQLSSYGWKTRTEYVADAFCTPQNTEILLRYIDEADLLLLTTPLHVDSLPYPVTRIMEQICGHRQSFDTSVILPTHFAVIINCGSPEAEHNDIAIAMCEQFAHQSHFEWSGGLNVGGGHRISNTDPAHFGTRLSSVTEGLDMAADSLAVGSVISNEAVALIAEPVMPSWMYRIIGGLIWNATAWRNGARKKITERPLLDKR